MATVRAKCKCVSVTHTENERSEALIKAIDADIQFNIYNPEKEPEFFKPGKEYNMEFTEVNN